MSGILAHWSSKRPKLFSPPVRPNTSIPVTKAGLWWYHTRPTYMAVIRDVDLSSMERRSQARGDRYSVWECLFCVD